MSNPDAPLWCIAITLAFGYGMLLGGWIIKKDKEKKR